MAHQSFLSGQGLVMDEAKYTEIRHQTAKGLVDLLHLHQSDCGREHLLLAAKFVVDDIVTAVTQGQVDCLTKGMERRDV